MQLQSALIASDNIESNCHNAICVCIRTECLLMLIRNCPRWGTARSQRKQCIRFIKNKTKWKMKSNACTPSSRLRDMINIYLHFFFFIRCAFELFKKRAREPSNSPIGSHHATRYLYISINTHIRHLWNEFFIQAETLMRCAHTQHTGAREFRWHNTLMHGRIRTQNTDTEYKNKEGNN